jgi:hypothetical protein
MKQVVVCVDAMNIENELAFGVKKKWPFYPRFPVSR